MIYFGVVLYNSLIENSPILKIDFKKMDFLYFFSDNSDNDFFKQKNKQYAAKNRKIKYIDNISNIGLSKAYNSILNEVPRKNDNSYIMWLDDDTKFSDDFLYEVDQAIKEGYDIIIPKVIGQNGVIYSPNEYGYLKNRLVLNKNEEKKINGKRINAINSCLTVKLSIYNRNLYDEQLFLDQVDQLFFDKIRKKKLKYKILSSSINQNFSQRNEIIGASYLSRFIIRKKDIITYGKLSPCNNILFSRLKVILLGLQLTIKTRDFSYLKEGLK